MLELCLAVFISRVIYEVWILMFPPVRRSVSEDERAEKIIALDPPAQPEEIHKGF